MNNIEIKKTNIDGLLEINIPVFYDERGYFKENWQREKMINLGLPDFKPVQHNISFNSKKGVTRGMHAEPWDKLVSVANGRVFACIVDLRDGENYGATFTAEIDEKKSLFIPAGCANSFQALEDDTLYSYLVNNHWKAELKYEQFNLQDANCTWPINLNDSIISEKDKNSKKFTEVNSYKKKKICIVGANGQLGKAFQQLFKNGEADFYDYDNLDITNFETFKNINWQNYFIIINCAAYTKVDLAEIEIENSYKVNVLGVENLCKIAKENNLELVHISTDYIFDGEKVGEYSETDLANPKNIYGLHKVLSEKIVENKLEKYYLIRTSWVIGDGKNFVNTMLDLSTKMPSLNIVNDQIGRPTFATDLAEFINFLIENKYYGNFNFSNDGEKVSWADFAREIFKIKKIEIKINSVSTGEYFADKVKNNIKFAVRPKNSVLDLSKAKNLNYKIQNWKDSLNKYLQNIK